MARTVCFYISGHGFGHATRCQVPMLALLRRGYTVHIVTVAPEFLFDEMLATHIDDEAERARLRQRVHIRKRQLDTGAKNFQIVNIDKPGTLQQYADIIHARHEELVASEAQWLAELRPDFVYSDAVALACSAAKRAGIAAPVVVVTNFTWLDIYSDYVKLYPQFADVLPTLTQDLLAADHLFRYPGYVSPIQPFETLAPEKIIDIAITARSPRESKESARRKLGIDINAKVLLLSFGGWDSKHVFANPQCIPSDWVGITSTSLDGLPSNFIRIERGVYMPDVIVAADVVIGKIGYGTISEVLVAKRPLLYVQFDDFPELPFLEALMKKHSYVESISREDFFSGNWGHERIERAREACLNWEQAAPGYSQLTFDTTGDLIADQIEELMKRKTTTTTHIE